MLYAFVWNLLLTAGLAAGLLLVSRTAWLQRRPSLRHTLWLLVLIIAGRSGSMRLIATPSRESSER